MGGVARQHNWALQPTVISIIEAVSQVKPVRSGPGAGPGAKIKDEVLVGGVWEGLGAYGGLGSEAPGAERC